MCGGQIEKKWSGVDVGGGRKKKDVALLRYSVGASVLRGKRVLTKLCFISENYF